MIRASRQARRATIRGEAKFLQRCDRLGVYDAGGGTDALRPSHVCREDVVMSVIRTPSRPDQSTGFARVDLVDHWHKDWPAVLHFVDQRGDSASLHVDDVGWLSARQNLLVAFVGHEPAAHVCFHVEPAHRQDAAAQACVEAKLDSFAIDPRFCGHGIERDLRKAALDRANSLKCLRLHGFDLNDKWC
jgi:hypothetical protein